MPPLNFVMAKLRFFTLFRLDLGIRELEVKLDRPKKLIEFLNTAEKLSPKPFLHKLIDENGNLIDSAIILINGKNVHHLQKLDTLIKDEDEIDLFPPGGGG